MTEQPLFRRLSDLAGHLTASLLRLLGNRAYYWLAAFISLAVLVDFTFFHQVKLMENRMFDMLVSQRLRYAAADPEIIIVDIDEASLSALAKDYGRWPWPRQVLGEWVEGVEKQKPRAIVFDILFSDSDIRNPDSEAYFNAAIAATDNTYFPMLRLGAQNDGLSQVRPSMLPWLKPLPGALQQDAPLAVVLPRFQAAIDSARIGTHQITPDKDSVIRHYPLFLEHAGWMIPSLPQRLAEKLGFPQSEPGQSDFLVNWRGKAFAFKTVSFADVYTDFLKKNRQRPPDEFAGKIVVLGSTAPSLFDIKASPTAKIFPGVEILATAIDNLKNGDSLRELHPGMTLAMALVFIWGMAIALSRHIPVTLFDQLFAGLQVLFIGIAYVTLNFSRYYIDMSAPVTFGLVFFSIARVYSGLSGRWLADHRLISRMPEMAGEYTLRVLAIATTATTGKEKRALIGSINQLVGESVAGAGRIGSLIEDSGMVQDMFAGILLVYWLTESGNDSAIATAANDARHIRQGIAGPFAHLTPRFALHEGIIDLTQEGNWKTAGKRIIIKALGRLVDEEETVPAQTIRPDNNRGH